MKYDVFISYSSHDQKVVEGLCGYLESLKIRCFVAYRDIPRGVVWARAIVEALDESRMMVVVFSDNFNNSDQVDREIELASEDKKPILTFRLTDDAFKGAKKYYLKNLNWIDAFPNPQEVFGAVAENVAKLLDIDIKTSAAQQESTLAPVEPESALAPVVPELTPTVVKTYKVGDYYNENGKEGVVFEVTADGRHGKIVSMKQSAEELLWSSDSDEQKRLIGADSETIGEYNTAKVKAISGWRSKYPAFAWCADFGEGWYLPSIEELKTFTLNDSVHDAVNRTLVTKGGVALFNKKEWRYYWSSTEENYKCHTGEFCAWLVSMFNGGTYDYNKLGSNGYVRAVATF